MATPAVQVLNSAHNDIQRTAFLPVMDRNWLMAIVDNVSQDQTNSLNPLTVPFATDLAIGPTELFSWDGVNYEITVSDYAGIFLVAVKLNVGSGSGSPDDTIVHVWLEKYTAQTLAWGEIVGSRVYQTAPPSHYNGLWTQIPVKVVQDDLPTKFRVRSQVVYPGGTHAAFIHANGRLFQVLSLQAENPVPES